MSPNIVALLYLLSGILFIFALRGLSSPETSRQGNVYGMAGMAIAIVTTLFQISAPELCTDVGPDHRRTWHRRQHRRRRSPGAFR